MAKRVADGHSHGGTAHRGGQPADRVFDSRYNSHRAGQETDVKLGTDRVEDGADQQGAEQALCHGTERIDPVAAK